MKKIFLILLTSLSLTACQTQETKTTKKNACDATQECEPSKKQESNHFTEITMEQALDVFKNSDSAILYFGYTDCPWCQEAGPILEEVAKEKDVEVLYVKTREDETHELLYSDEQREQIAQYIGKWMETNPEEDKLWLYVPLVIKVEEGLATEGHESTLPDHDANEREMNDQEKEELKKIYTEIVEGLTSNLVM